MSLRSEVIRIMNELIGNGKKISELPSADPITGSELVEIVQGGVNKRSTVSSVSTGGSSVLSIVAGDNITVDSTDPQNPIVSAESGGIIESVSGDLVDNTDPNNPVVNLSHTATAPVNINMDGDHFSITGANNIDLEGAGNMTLTPGGNFNVSSVGIMTIESNDSMTIDAPDITSQVDSYDIVATNYATIIATNLNLAGSTSVNISSSNSASLTVAGDGLTVTPSLVTSNANLDMGGNKVTGLAAAGGNGEAVRHEQILDLETKLDRATSSTAGGTITLDMSSLRQRMFVGSASFSTAKILALSNATNALVFNFHFELTDLATITVPSDWLLADANFDGTLWTPTITGLYEIGGSFDGTYWKVKIMGPFL